MPQLGFSFLLNSFCMLLKDGQKNIFQWTNMMKFKRGDSGASMAYFLGLESP